MKNDLVSKDVLDLYNYVDMRNIILNIFELFKYLEKTNDKIVIPRITNGYQVRYEQFVPIGNSAVENFVFKKMMLETKIEDNRRQLLSKIAVALRKLNELELAVFRYTFYENKNEYEISRIIHYGVRKVYKIRKSACIKFLWCLGLDDKCLKKDVGFVLN